MDKEKSLNGKEKQRIKYVTCERCGASGGKNQYPLRRIGELVLCEYCLTYVGTQVQQAAPEDSEPDDSN